MEKILSIIIPTYNMEEYLPRCLDSVVGTQYINDIEIIVVNDGSKDRSSEIAHSYKSKFPQSVVVIDKENGNYGSTINAALPIASGKYVKILDADDWFDTIALDEYILSLSNIDADMILTNYTRIYTSGKKRVYNYSLKNDIEYDLSVFVGGKNRKSNLPMHTVTYRTSLLTANNYRQTEGISYTDNEWIFYPLQYVNRVRFVDLNLYQYLIGREGQTMDKKVRMNNMHQVHSIIKNMVCSRVIEGNYKLPQIQFMTKLLVYRLLPIYLPFWDKDKDGMQTIINVVESPGYELTREILNGCTVSNFFKFKPIKYYIKYRHIPPIVLRFVVRLFLKFEDRFNF